MNVTSHVESSKNGKQPFRSALETGLQYYKTKDYALNVKNEMINRKGNTQTMAGALGPSPVELQHVAE
jgi:hypothetical protein